LPVVIAGGIPRSADKRNNAHFIEVFCTFRSVVVRVTVSSGTPARCQSVRLATQNSGMRSQTVRPEAVGAWGERLGIERSVALGMPIWRAARCRHRWRGSYQQ
jgi:hypothetical protein